MNYAAKNPSSLAAFGLTLAAYLATSGIALADRITLRIATGHPPGVVYAGLMTLIIVKVVKALVGLRVDHEEELEGLDVRTHGERGYLL